MRIPVIEVTCDRCKKSKIYVPKVVVMPTDEENRKIEDVGWHVEEGSNTDICPKCLNVHLTVQTA